MRTWPLALGSLLIALLGCTASSSDVTAPQGTFSRKSSFLLVPVEFDMANDRAGEDARRDAQAIYDEMVPQATKDVLLACVERDVNVSTSNPAPDFVLRVRFTREEVASYDFDTPNSRLVAATFTIEQSDGTVLASKRRTKVEKRIDAAKSISQFLDVIPTYVGRFMADAVGIRASDFN